MARLLEPKTWGGALELAAMSQHFQVEIWCWDVKDGTLHRFGEERGYTTLWPLLYSGIHYDALYALPELDAPIDWATTTFTITPEEEVTLRDAGSRLAAALRERH